MHVLRRRTILPRDRLLVAIATHADHVALEQTRVPRRVGVVAGEADPIALLHEYAGRVPRLHAKEAWPAKMSMEEAGTKDVGDGLVDWSAVLQTAFETGVEWIVSEHDDPVDPLLSMRRSAAYLSARIADLSTTE